MTAYGHYTSQKGLMGIINSDIVWATNIKFLNDEHEFFHALKMIKEKLSKPKTKKTDPDFSKVEAFVALLEKKIKNLDLYKVDSIYTFSLSAEIDLLSQWRGYCPENNGFCLEFDINKLVESAKTKYKEVHQLDCVYNNQEAQIIKLMNDYWHKYNKAKGRGKTDIINELVKEITLLASHYKHSSFSEEKETRIVIILEDIEHGCIKFREGKTSIIPYIEIPISPDAIQKIWIGPTVNASLAKKGLELFLENKYDYTSVPILDVVFSKIPYRPL